MGAPTLKRFDSRLVTYAGAPVNVKGVCEAEVKIEGQTQLLPVLVVGGSGPALCGRNWLRNLKLNCEEILSVPEEFPEKKSQKWMEKMMKTWLAVAPITLQWRAGP